MRTLLPILVLALCASVPASGQAIRFDSTATTTSAQCVSGKQCPLLVLPGTRVNFCQGTPSTVGGCLSSPATTYTSQAASVPCSTTAQLTPGVGGACLSTADAQGGYGAWLLPGSYSYYLRVPVTAGGGTYGPYVLSIHGDSGGYTLDSLYATLDQACTGAGSGSLAITRAWNALTSVPAGCNFWFLNGGLLQPAAASTISPTGTITAAPGQRIFDISTGGTVNLSGMKNGSITVKNFGAVGNGSTNDYAALQAAHQAGIETVYPCATSGYLIGSSTLTVPSTNDVTQDIGCTFVLTSGNGGVVIQNPINQKIQMHAKRSSQQWTSTDGTSVGILMDCASSSGCGKFRATIMAENYWTGFHATTSGGDIIDFVMEYEDYETNKIADFWEPSSPHAIDQANHLMYRAKLNQSCVGAIAGTRHTVLGSQQPNMHTWINPEHEDDCAEHTFESYGTNIQLVGYRCEGCVANSILFHSTTYLNSISGPGLFSDSGVASDVIQDDSGHLNEYCAILDCAFSGKRRTYIWYAADGSVNFKIDNVNKFVTSLGGYKATNIPYPGLTPQNSSLTLTACGTGATYVGGFLGGVVTIGTGGTDHCRIDGNVPPYPTTLLFCAASASGSRYQALAYDISAAATSTLSFHIITGGTNMAAGDKMTWVCPSGY